MHEAGAMRNRAGLTGSEKLVAAGTAGRTVAVDNAGVKCCNMHANLTGKCALSDVTEDDAEGDNLLDLLADFGCWLAATQVQNSRNTRSTDSPICVTTSTKMQCFGEVKEESKRMFPRHACWVSEEWYTKQRDLVNALIEGLVASRCTVLLGMERLPALARGKCTLLMRAAYITL